MKLRPAGSPPGSAARPRQDTWHPATGGCDHSVLQGRTGVSEIEGAAVALAGSPASADGDGWPTSRLHRRCHSRARSWPLVCRHRLHVARERALVVFRGGVRRNAGYRSRHRPANRGIRPGARKATLIRGLRAG